MARYGMDYGRREPMGRMDRGYGGGRPGTGGWMGEGAGGGMGQDFGRRGGSGYEGWGNRGGRMERSDRTSRGYGAGYGGGYGGREMGYGGMYERDMGGGYGMQRMRAAEIMTENPESVTPDTSLADVAKKMRELNVGIIPVVDSAESRRLRGVITDRDIAIRAVAEGKDGKAKVSDCMTSEVQTVNKNDPVGEVLDLMGREQVRRVPVTDREGRLVGIIAQADLAVDYAEGAERERRMERTLERISEPARPRRSGAQGQNREGMMASGRTGPGEG